MTANLTLQHKESSTIKPLRDRTAEEHAQWLLRGLREYLLEGKGRRAFPEEEIVHKIDLRDTTIEDNLADAYEALPVESRDAFRDGCFEALISLNFYNNQDAQIATSIMRLCAHIKAVGAVDVIAEKNFGNFAERLKSPMHYFTYDVKRELSYEKIRSREQSEDVFAQWLFDTAKEACETDLGSSNIHEFLSSVFKNDVHMEARPNFRRGCLQAITMLHPFTHAKGVMALRKLAQDIEAVEHPGKFFTIRMARGLHNV